MSFYTYIKKDFDIFINNVDINSFSNELHKFIKNITIQSIIFFISDIKNLKFVKKYFSDDKLKNIEPQYLYYLAIIVMEKLNMKEKEIIEYNKSIFSRKLCSKENRKKQKYNQDSVDLSSFACDPENIIDTINKSSDKSIVSSCKYSNKKLFSEEIVDIITIENKDKNNIISNLPKVNKINKDKNFHIHSSSSTFSEMPSKEHTINSSSIPDKKIKKVRGSCKKKLKSSIPILPYHDDKNNDLLFSLDELCNDNIFNSK